MDGCLLCLEINKEFVNYIGVNSKQWQELNIKNLIEKHFWVMDAINTSSSWLCKTCWNELNDFHKFYTRIEEAHLEFGLIIRNEKLETNLPESKSTVHNNSSFSCENEIKDDIINETEISLHENLLLTELVIEEQKPLIKIEHVEDDQCDDDMPLREISKRGRRAKNVTSKKTKVTNKDPLIKSIKSSKQVKVTKPRAKKSKVSTTVSATQPENNRIQIEQTDIKQEPDLQHNSEEIPKILLDLHDDDQNHLDANDSDDSDSNYEPEKGESLEGSKEHKTPPNRYYTPKTKRHEKDQFIADNFKISCVVCQIPLETFNSMRKHFELEHNQRGYVTCCNKKFYRRSVLVDHVHRHLDPNFFKCQQCAKVMSDRRCLELHMKTHEMKPEKIHSCDICGKSFGTRSVLKTHKSIHLSEEEKQFPCSDCGKNFGNSYLLSNHVRVVHLNKYTKICDMCGKSMRSKEIFERHMLEHEGKPAPTISCDICGLRLANKRGLKRHKDMIHPVGGKQQYTCSICSKISPNLRAHKRHVQYKHELGYDHKCTICEKAFKRAHSLTEHMATHTGTVLYTCLWCPKTFNSNANMHNHRKKCHPKEWEEAARKRYSGNLPPNYKPPSMNNVSDEYSIPIDL